MKPIRLKDKLTESQLQLQIIQYLGVRSTIIVGKTKTMGVKRGKVYCFDPYTFRGFPDLTAFMRVNSKRTIILFIEVKSEKGIQSIYQKNFERLCKYVCGVRYILARKLEDVIKIVKEYK